MDTSKANGGQPAEADPSGEERTEPGMIRESSDAAGDAADPRAKEVADLLAKLKEQEAKYVYLYAEFENFKKRAFKERDEARKFGWEGVATDLLEVVDNLERATAHMPPGVDKNLAQGIQLVLSQFKSTLSKNGVQEIDTLKKPFDPNFHEAVGQEPSPEAAGTIIREHQKGYLLHGRLLRPSRVIVSSGPAK